MNNRFCSTKIRYQTFSDPWVERNDNFPTSARPSLKKRPFNWVKSLPVFRPKRRKNFTHSGGTYLSPGRQAGNSSFNLNTEENGNMTPLNLSLCTGFRQQDQQPQSVKMSRQAISNSVCIHFLCLCCSGGLTLLETNKDTKSRNQKRKNQ